MDSTLLTLLLENNIPGWMYELIFLSFIHSFPVQEQNWPTMQIHLATAFICKHVILWVQDLIEE